jgi:uncharacterized cofD-like protein
LVKRWFVVSALGVVLIILGLAISARLTPVRIMLDFFSRTIDVLVTLLPRQVSGPLAIGLGLVLLWLGQRRLFMGLIQALMPGRNPREAIVDQIIAHHTLNRGPKLVAIGGGTGLSNLLRGLKKYSANITAIVTVADDGGSSGRLRREQGMLPPGDIRNCLTALADEEKLLTELFQYRFNTGEGLAGHSFGNLFLTAMTHITGDLERAIRASSEVLSVRGRVLPATIEDMVLYAHLEDGRYVEGESQITNARGKIVRIGCKPDRPKAVPQSVADIFEADLLILGPGSLYTSIIPNLLIPEIAEALISRHAPCIYVCNIMTQPGETDGFTVADHVHTIDRVVGQGIIDLVIAQKSPPSAQTQDLYSRHGSTFVHLDRERLECPVLAVDVMAEENGKVRHDSDKLANVIMAWFNHQT